MDMTPREPQFIRIRVFGEYERNTAPKYQILTITNRREFGRVRTVVTRRFRDFLMLRRHLLQGGAGTLPRLTRIASERLLGFRGLEARRIILEVFLNRLARDPNTLTKECFLKFLKDPVYDDRGQRSIPSLRIRV